MGHQENCGQRDIERDHCGIYGGHTHSHGHSHNHHDHCGHCENCEDDVSLVHECDECGQCDECGECGSHGHPQEDDPELREKMLRLSDEVIQLTENTLLVHLRFLDAAIHQMIPVAVDDLNLGTDGRYMAFSPAHMLQCYKNERERTARDILHVLFHCVFRHMFVDTLIDRYCWDLACDIAVEYAITRLELKAVSAQREAWQLTVYDDLKENIGRLTAERIYRFLLDGGLPPEKMDELANIFYADEHALWYSSQEDSEQESDRQSPSGSSDDEGEDQPDGQSDGESQMPENEPDESLEERWNEISRRMQVDMETLSREREDKAGALMQNLREANRERYDYTRFLNKFAVRGEIVKINPDEFDYIYYTYGLKLYKNMPLIEPLEYKEVNRIREFVIAIDTSGSVSGKLVQLFVQKTYNILKTTASFFSKINLHIIQCDAEIQQAVKITNQKEFDQYLETMEIRGLGGTDFQPVFRYVEQLRQNGEFENLKGLIYFTDGFGVYPKSKPDYDTAFVFVDDGINDYEVPPWAIRLVLRPEELI